MEKDSKSEYEYCFKRLLELAYIQPRWIHHDCPACGYIATSYTTEGLLTNSHLEFECLREFEGLGFCGHRWSIAPTELKIKRLREFHRKAVRLLGEIKELIESEGFDE